MLLVTLVGHAIQFTFLEFLQFPVLPPSRLVGPFLACLVGDILHVNRAMVTGVCCEEGIVAVWWVDWRLLLREECP